MRADGGITPKQHDGWMWDLTVPGNDDHDFYVIPAQTNGGHDTYGVVEGVAPVLVHNSTPCPLEEAALKPGEADTASRLMADPSYNGGQLRGFAENNAGEDFIDENGKTYDAIGTARAYSNWNSPQFLRALYGHLYQKSADYTVLDLTGASSDQIDSIFSAMDSWAENAAPRSPAIILGGNY